MYHKLKQIWHTFFPVLILSREVKPRVVNLNHSIFFNTPQNSQQCMVHIFLNSRHELTLIIIFFSNEDCVLNINLNNTRFQVGDTFALPITVKDYSRRDVAASSVYNAYARPIGRGAVLVCRMITFDKVFSVFNTSSGIKFQVNP